MATIAVTSSSALASALRTVANGDTITLAGGHYTLSTSGLSKAVTITSSAGAVFDSIDLSRTSNLTIDGVDFNGQDGEKNGFRVYGSNNITIQNADMEGVADGVGLGRGLFVQASTDVTLANMTMHGFETGVWLDRVTGVVLENNTLTDLSLDGFVGGGIHDATYSGNSITLDIPAGRKHSDGIQFWNTTNQPSTDILIEDNVIRANNSQSHGIYMANASATKGSNGASFFHDVTIQGNTIVSGDGLGLSWGQTDNLDIHRNIVLRDPTLPPDRETPSIRIHTDATDISVTGNVTHKVPIATGVNWQPASHSGGNWMIANNPIIRVGASLAEAQALLASSGGSARLASSASAPSDTADHITDDAFRFAAGAGSAVSADSTSATIGSQHEHLAETASASSAHEESDTPILDIQPPAVDHAYHLIGLAHECI